MKDGDVVWMLLNSDGSFVIEDRYARDIGVPTPDSRLAGCSEDLFNKNAVLSSDGTTTFTWSRLIIPNDTVCDHPFHTGKTSVMFAFSPTVKLTPHIHTALPT
jgi:hypothetical protein